MGTNQRTIQVEDFVLQRGNEETVTINFTDNGSPYNLTGKTLVFRALGSGIENRKQSGDADFTITAPATLGQVVIEFSVPNTRELPLRVPVPYEIENITDNITLVQGSITGVGGTNDDP